MELGSYFLFLQEQIKDIIIISLGFSFVVWVCSVTQAACGCMYVM
jgi:hypothetical protein